MDFKRGELNVPRSAVSPCEVNEQFLKEQLLEGGEEGVTM